MKRVALFSDGWKRLITYAWVDGMMEYMSQSDEKICLHQYNCHGNWSHDEKHNYGEYNIYNLPDLSEFDGIIMDCTNISDKNVFEKLVDMLRKSNKPVVSIGNHIEGFYYVGIDNKKPIADMMEHLYNIHNCRKFIFAGGSRDNYENELRVLSYKESIERFGLSIEENPVWYGDYDFSTGVNYFNSYMDKFPKGKIDFPDVFVCANDNIASGFCYGAQECGYKIPEDFRITGFDNLDKAIYFDPQITTVSHMRENIGNRAMEILTEVWSGKELSDNHFMPSKCIFTESCGCPNSGLLDYRKYARNQVITEVERLEREEMLISLESDIIKCVDYNDVARQIADYFSGLECDGFAIILDKRLYDGAGSHNFMTTGYDWENLTVAYATEKGQFIDIADPKKLLEFYEACGAGSSYMYTPIHFREYAVGFSILKNGKFLYDNPHFYDIQSTITKTIENLYKKLCVEMANKKLSEVYNRDQLTGLYNRIAYTEMIEPEYRKHCSSGRKCVINFVDADNFKAINDNYGHEMGDMVLKKIARVLVEKCRNDGFVYRYGGDEFIAFFPLSDEDEPESFKNEVTAELEKYYIHVSIGVIVTDPSSDKIFADYMRLADTEMYRVKAARKAKKQNKF